MVKKYLAISRSGKTITGSNLKEIKDKFKKRKRITQVQLLIRRKRGFITAGTLNKKRRK